MQANQSQYFAQVAIYAARMRKVWGAWASRRYALKRGCHPHLYTLACQLEAANRAFV